MAVEYNDGYGNTEPPKNNNMKKASERIKRSLSVEEISKRIDDIEKHNPTNNKIFIPHFELIDDDVKVKFMNAGYKVYKSDWDAIMKDVLIIEW